MMQKTQHKATMRRENKGKGENQKLKKIKICFGVSLAKILQIKIEKATKFWMKQKNPMNFPFLIEKVQKYNCLKLDYIKENLESIKPSPNSELPLSNHEGKKVKDFMSLFS
jgi:hypothetical protein